MALGATAARSLVGQAVTISKVRDARKERADEGMKKVIKTAELADFDPSHLGLRQRPR